MRYLVEVGDRSYDVEIGPQGVRLDGVPVDADLKLNHGSPLCHLVLDGRSYTLRARRQDGRGLWDIEIDGRRHQVSALDERRRAIRKLAGAVGARQGPVEVTAPMPGLVIAVEVNADEQVESGQGLVVIEAMKMENELRAPTAGRVTEVRARPGQAVEKGDALLIIDPGEGSASSSHPPAESIS